MRGLLLAAYLLAIPGDLVAQDIDVPQRAMLIIRSYRHSLADEEFRIARAGTAAILGQAGISISWLQCWSPRYEDPLPLECTRPIGPTEVIVHIMPARGANAAMHLESLGFSLVDLETGTGSVATVYADRVHALARRADVDSGVLVARAIAHEVGHILIGFNRHAAGGLMRALWSRAELKRDAAADWTFSEQEAREMRGAIKTRLSTLTPRIHTSCLVTGC
jgi:hypothetical protein